MNKTQHHHLCLRTTGKEYPSRSEEQSRYHPFMENKIMIAEHNKLAAEGEYTFTMAINQFADMVRNIVLRNWYYVHTFTF